MKILKEGIVSNSSMIKKYKSCRDRAEITGRLFIIKNNKLDAVLFSISEFEKLTPVLEYFESLSLEDNMAALNLLQSMTHPTKIKALVLSE